jgi:hypothetical protein
MIDTTDHLVLTYLTVDDTETSSQPTTAPNSRPVSAVKLAQQTITEIDVEAKGEQPALAMEAWTPTKNEWLIMISLAFISLMVALDATILVTVLPVSLLRGYNSSVY